MSDSHLSLKLFPQFIGIIYNFVLRAEEKEHDLFLASLDSVLWTTIPGAS